MAQYVDVDRSRQATVCGWMLLIGITTHGPTQLPPQHRPVFQEPKGEVDHGEGLEIIEVKKEKKHHALKDRDFFPARKKKGD